MDWADEDRVWEIDTILRPMWYHRDSPTHWLHSGLVCLCTVFFSLLFMHHTEFLPHILLDPLQHLFAVNPVHDQCLAIFTDWQTFAVPFTPSCVSCSLIHTRAASNWFMPPRVIVFLTSHSVQSKILERATSSLLSLPVVAKWWWNSWSNVWWVTMKPLHTLGCGTAPHTAPHDLHGACLDACSMCTSCHGVVYWKVVHTWCILREAIDHEVLCKNVYC